MPKPAYARCRTCGKSRAEVGELSHTRQCEACGMAALRENVEGLVAHSGPAFTRWRHGMAACIGLQLLDAAPLTSDTSHR